MLAVFICVTKSIILCQLVTVWAIWIFMYIITDQVTSMIDQNNGSIDSNLIKNSKALFKIIKFLNVSDLTMSVISKK